MLVHTVPEPADPVLACLVLTSRDATILNDPRHSCLACPLRATPDHYKPILATPALVRLAVTVNVTPSEACFA
jgi:hypothetical protein